MPYDSADLVGLEAAMDRAVLGGPSDGTGKLPQGGREAPNVKLPEWNIG
jgi:hypothetical protein